MHGIERTRELAAFAEDVILKAGDVALRYFRADLEMENKADNGSYDPVTRADREVEAYIRTRIHEQFPDHDIIGEEYGEERRSADNVWIIDPIDGTRGFVAGTPMWGMLLGLMTADRCEVGLMRQPLLDETYVGSEVGAFVIDGKGRRPLHTRATSKAEEGILCCTHINMFKTDDQWERFRRVLSACRFSRFGTDCYAYGLLARGLVDMIVEADLETYDIVPLIPLVEAAGGVISDWHGGSALNGGAVVAAANAELHEQILEILN